MDGTIHTLLPTSAYRNMEGIIERVGIFIFRVLQLISMDGTIHRNNLHTPKYKDTLYLCCGQVLIYVWMVPSIQILLTCPSINKVTLSIYS